VTTKKKKPRKKIGIARTRPDGGVIIHGNGVEAHDKRLFAVLDMLREVGLTFKV